MTWEQLSVNKPHWAYLILGGFTSLFMLCSLFVKEKLYIGEATVATLCGVIFGPHAANLFNPLSWGNVDQITLECSRVVLVVQCFAVGVELPKAYMERHWRSVVFLLVPVMTFGWLVTSLFIWWMIEPLTWLESLVCAACVTATDPVLASSVVGKGKFAKRVPKHLRDVLSAESGCNDGMAFPFIYLSFYILHYRPDTHKVALHWFCNTILYECVFGAFYGFMIGYIGRHAIKWADRKDLVDRESFLVFYFVLALFCAGTGATLGTDDLLVGFAAGVGFSNDGWFTEKTEESHVSNVIDLLLNLAYFVYLGAIIPWEQYNNPLIGLTPWRLVVIAIFVILFRRIPIMMALKPFIPDIKTWREALFAGHFGPIGVGAIFAAILARAELETDTTVPLAVVPTDPESENYTIVQIIWPLTTFLVISSILVHGSSIAVFTLGKRINHFTLTMSYTQANEEGPTWMNRLPRIASTMSRTSMSKGKDDFSAASSMEKVNPDYPPGMLPPIGMPGNFLRRQKEEDTPIEKPKAARRKSKWDSNMRAGGVIEASAIAPQRPPAFNQEESTSDTLDEKISSSPTSSEEETGLNEKLQTEKEAESETKKDEQKKSHRAHEPELEAFEEGNDMIIEDEEGNTLAVYHTKGETEEQKQQHIFDEEAKLRAETSGEHAKSKHHPHEKNEGEDIEEAIEQAVEHPEQTSRSLFRRLGAWDGFKRKEKEPEPKPNQGSVPARAYQFGHTLIVEDEDGEVLKKIDLTQSGPGRGRGGVQNAPSALDAAHVRQGLKRVGTWTGLGGGKADDAAVDAAAAQAATATETGPSSDEPPANPSGAAQGPTRPDIRTRKKSLIGRSLTPEDDPDDERLRFTVGAGGRRMSKQEFVAQLSQMDPKGRRDFLVDNVSVPPAVQEDPVAEDQSRRQSRPSVSGRRASSSRSAGGAAAGSNNRARSDSRRSPNRGTEMGATLSTLPEDPSSGDKTAGLDLLQPSAAAGPDGAGTKASGRSRSPSAASTRSSMELRPVETVPTHNPAAAISRASATSGVGAETAAQRRRRIALQRQDSDDDGTFRVPPQLMQQSSHQSGSGGAPTSPAAARRAMQQQQQPAPGGERGETAAERRRRLAALGEDSGGESSDSEDDGEERRITPSSKVAGSSTSATTGGGAGGATAVPAPGNLSTRTTGIRFAESPTGNQGRNVQGGAGGGSSAFKGRKPGPVSASSSSATGTAGGNAASTERAQAEGETGGSGSGKKGFLGLGLGRGRK